LPSCAWTNQTQIDGKITPRADDHDGDLTMIGWMPIYVAIIVAVAVWKRA
jgi:hypothetical protein